MTVESRSLRFFARGVDRIIPTTSLPASPRTSVAIDDPLVRDLVVARAAALGLADQADDVTVRLVRGPQASPAAVDAHSEIVLVDHVDAEALAHCGRRGVVAVLSLQAPAAMLDLALTAPGRDAGLILDPMIAARLAGRDGRRNAEVPRASLTTRQIEILRELGAGRSMKQIASALGITIKTVENQATRIYATLGAGNRHEAVHVAREIGLIGDGA